MINKSQIEAFLIMVGKRCKPESTLFLLGGGALEMLGGARPTVDLDYVGNDLQPDKLQQLMIQIADEIHIELEAVPIAKFVPLPTNAHKRAILVGEFGNLTVYIFDPYTIALSKLDRGFDTDIEDILFLIQRQLITVKQLAEFVENAASHAHQFDLEPEVMRRHLQVLRQSI
ncbi:MAG: hypothetical protein GY803_28625 [Chloroflexi bacterium]|nr:hypothetical protein [Chloroflexota bacterium]